MSGRPQGAPSAGAEGLLPGDPGRSRPGTGAGPGSAEIAALWLTREAVVTAIPSDGFEGHRICCACVPVPGEDAGPAALRRELGRLLPGYMIPARWMRWERLPRNGSGKIDRRRVREALQAPPEPERGRPAALAAVAAAAG